MSDARRPPHVAVLVETSRSYGRGLLRGVRRYVAEHGPWSVFLELRALDSPEPPWLPGWRGDGILTRTGTPKLARAVRAAGVPAVELRTPRLSPGLPFVGVDNRALGRLVCDHLLERGFRRLGVFELGTEPFFAERRDDFLAAAAAAGCPCDVFRSGGRESPARWERQQDALARWVAGLTKPVGLMACTDQLAFWLLDACKRAGVAVPDEAAVVGVEDDESLCGMADPPLSSVRFNAERTGYLAAEILAGLMAGRAAPPGPVLVPPLGVVTRQSSDVVAVEDEEVARAVRLIRARACGRLTVDDVCRELAVSRSALERRMRAALGHSPKAEIARVRMGRVRELLMDTDLPLEAVASRCGFRHAHYLVEAFRKRFGTTPGAFRASAGGRQKN